MNTEELIQAYLRNKLGKAEKAEVEELIRNDVDFRKEVDFQRDLKAAFSDMERSRIKSKLKNFETELKTPKQKTYTAWLVAASVVIILGVGLMTIFNNPSGSDQLYMAYFEPYENVVQPITRSQSIETMKTTVFIAYEKAAYEKAAQGFKKLYEATDESYYLLYRGNALMANNQLKKAVPILEKHLALNDAFAGKSRWYLALAYLKTDEASKAKKLLEEIVNKKGYKANDAKAILKKL